MEENVNKIIPEGIIAGDKTFEPWITKNDIPTDYARQEDLEPLSRKSDLPTDYARSGEVARMIDDIKAEIPERIVRDWQLENATRALLAKIEDEDPHAYANRIRIKFGDGSYHFYDYAGLVETTIHHDGGYSGVGNVVVWIKAPTGGSSPTSISTDTKLYSIGNRGWGKERADLEWNNIPVKHIYATQDLSGTGGYDLTADDWQNVYLATKSDLDTSTKDLSDKLSGLSTNLATSSQISELLCGGLETIHPQIIYLTGNATDIGEAIMPFINTTRIIWEKKPGSSEVSPYFVYYNLSFYEELYCAVPADVVLTTKEDVTLGNALPEELTEVYKIIDDKIDFGNEGGIGYIDHIYPLSLYTIDKKIDALSVLLKKVAQKVGLTDAESNN